MAPINRPSSTKINVNARRPTVFAENIIANKSIPFAKRKAESSPPKNGNFKRPALNEITNEGKTTIVKHSIKNGKSGKTNVEVSVDTLKKSNSYVPETRSRSSKLVSGIRIQGPFKGKVVNNCQPLENKSTLLKNTESLKLKSTIKPFNRTSVVTRTSLSSKSNAGKPVKSEKSLLEKSVQKVSKEANGDNFDSAKPAVLLPKLRLRSSTSNSSSQNEETNKTSLGKSLKNLEKIEVSVQSLIANIEKRKDGLQSSHPDSINDKSGHVVKLRRSLRNIVEKTEAPNHINNSCVPNGESKVPTEEPVTTVKLRRSLRNAAEKTECPSQSSIENQLTENEPKVSRRSSTRLSLRKSLSCDKSTDNGSLYVSALEEINSSTREQENDTKEKRYSELSEFDKELLHDPQQVSLYAMEIFDYLKSREAHFPIADYMSRQPHIDKKMRAMLVDWMVEVQENFELNHETLYLSVKLLDSYLSHVEIRRESLQLVGAAALFLACKYDERLAPLIEEFEYVGDGAYNKTRLLTMEQSILRHVKYELSFPISYSFLRRYARCARIQMPLLTLARYILELGLMEYDTITLSDSKQAAAALYLAFQMVKHSNWTDSLKYYTGYSVQDFKDIVILFNRILHQKPSSQLMTIRNKYSHELFFHVAQTPLLNNEDLNLN